MCKRTFALQFTVSPKPVVIMLAQDKQSNQRYSSETLNPCSKIVSLQRNADISQPSMLVLCLKLSKTQTVLFAVKLEIISQDKISIGLSSLLFVSAIMKDAIPSLLSHPVS